jgi:NIMA (never in mitosis gene a)-related kinase
MSLKDFELGKELGKGAFGAVSIVKRKADGESYAMKRVKIQQLGNKERENALNEVRILASLSHPNIVAYKEAFFDENSKTLNIVMELADDGDLDKKIQFHTKSMTHFKEQQIWSYLSQILQGLKHLHDNKIMHRDLKCANIFTMKNGSLKLGDLNVSKIVEVGMAYTQTGTPYYASPEVWSDKPYDYKSDLWSVGCIIYELCSLKPPFKGSSLEQLYKNVLKGVYENIPKRYSSDLSTIVSMLLQTNPIKRPTCDDLLNNPILIRNLQDKDDFFDENINPNNQLLSTIKMPKNLNDIKQRLPKDKKYDSDKKLITVEKTDYIEPETRKITEGSQNKDPSLPSCSNSNNSNPTNQKKEILNNKNQQVPVLNNINANGKIVIKDNLVNNRPISSGNQVKVKNVLGDNYIENMNTVNKLLNNIGNQQDIKSRPLSSRPQILRSNIGNQNKKVDDEVSHIIRMNKLAERPRSPNRSPRVIKPVLDSHDRKFIEKVKNGDFRSKVSPAPQQVIKIQSPYENKANFLNYVNNKANERVFSQGPKIIRHRK